MSGDLIYANGVDGLTGQYLLPPVSAEDVAARIKGDTEDSSLKGWLESVLRKVRGKHYGLPWDVDVADPSQAGWGVVLAADEDPDVKAEVERLVEHRRGQFGDDMVKVLDYQAEESWSDWLTRHGTGPGNIDPSKVPFYLLLIGSPARVPFRLQYLLDVEYAVGRLDFDEAADYGSYVKSVIAGEDDAVPPRSRLAAFFGTRHPHDPATEASFEQLVRPLIEGETADRPGVVEALGFESTALLGESATKANLGDLLQSDGPDGRFSLLFSATHGIGGWPAGHPQQTAKHGALLCQDWQGLGSMNASTYFAASDLPADANVQGAVAFFFACYSAGTPRADEFAVGTGDEAPTIADEPFVAALPKAMLAHPNGGALAAIGHIERAWGHSFLSEAGPLLVPFQSAIAEILRGSRLGWAIQDFNQRYAALSANLSTVLRDISFGKTVDDVELAALWTQRNDAQNYVLIGDPAVQLRVEDP